MNAIAAAIYAKLTADATLTALLASATSVYEAQAPEGASMPYVIFQKMHGMPKYTLSARTHRTHLYMVKAVSESPADSVDAQPPGAIDARIDTLIGTDGTLTISGSTQMYTRRQSDLPEYQETRADKVYLHRGGLYEIWTS